ncbi:DUF4116 domain-containing protein [Treponema sp. R6D11]
MNKNSKTEKIILEEGFLSNKRHLASTDYYTVFFKNATLRDVNKFLKTLPVTHFEWESLMACEYEYTVTETSPFKVEIQCSTEGTGMYRPIIDAVQECSLWALLVCMEQRKEDGKRMTLYSYQEIFKKQELIQRDLQNKVRTISGREEFVFEDNDTSAFQTIATRDEAVKTDLEPIVRMWLARNMKTEALLFDAVRKNGWALEYVPEELKTRELCLEALMHTQSKNTIQFLPKKFKTVKLYIEAIKRNIRLFHYVPKKLQARVFAELKKSGGEKVGTQS